MKKEGEGGGGQAGRQLNDDASAPTDPALRCTRSYAPPHSPACLPAALTQAGESTTGPVAIESCSAAFVIVQKPPVYRAQSPRRSPPARAPPPFSPPRRPRPRPSAAQARREPPATRAQGARARSFCGPRGQAGLPSGAGSASFRSSTGGRRAQAAAGRGSSALANDGRLGRSDEEGDERGRCRGPARSRGRSRGRRPSRPGRSSSGGGRRG